SNAAATPFHGLRTEVPALTALAVLKARSIAPATTPAIATVEAAKAVCRRASPGRVDVASVVALFPRAASLILTPRDPWLGRRSAGEHTEALATILRAISEIKLRTI